MEKSYQERLDDLIRKAYKEKNAASYVYYWQAKKFSACQGYEIFSKSWAGEQWLKRNRQEIENAFSADKPFAFSSLTSILLI